MEKTISAADVIRAEQTLKKVAKKTPLLHDEMLSEQYGCNVLLKREDLQVVRSFKIRGAYNKIANLTPEELSRGVVCASAGNHAQGVALSCRVTGAHGAIFMPITTPKQKIDRVSHFGGENVEILLEGDTFDDSAARAIAFAKEHNMVFVHPFDDPLVVAGQGTVGLEILGDADCSVDYIFVAVGGGGLASGVASYVKHISPNTKVIGVEPTGAACMKAAFENGGPVELAKIDKFVDGTAVKKAGQLTYAMCKKYLDEVVVLPEGEVCSTILRVYNDSAIVLEPAGALPISALNHYRSEIAGKNVVCVISGGNNDIARMQEIKERSMLYEGLKHYFIVQLPQRPGALRELVVDVLGPNDDISRFEYTKSNDREKGPILLGIELMDKNDLEPLIARMEAKGFQYTKINEDTLLFNLFV